MSSVYSGWKETEIFISDSESILIFKIFLALKVSYVYTICTGHVSWSRVFEICFLYNSKRRNIRKHKNYHFFFKNALLGAVCRIKHSLLTFILRAYATDNIWETGFVVFVVAQLWFSFPLLKLRFFFLYLQSLLDMKTLHFWSGFSTLLSMPILYINLEAKTNPFLKCMSTCNSSAFSFPCWNHFWKWVNT